MLLTEIQRENWSVIGSQKNRITIDESNLAQMLNNNFFIGNADNEQHIGSQLVSDMNTDEIIKCIYELDNKSVYNYNWDWDDFDEDFEQPNMSIKEIFDFQPYPCTETGKWLEKQVRKQRRKERKKNGLLG